MKKDAGSNQSSAKRLKVNVYGQKDCFACEVTDKYLSKRKDIEYKFYDISDKTNEKKVHQLLPDFNIKNSVIPVIQKCTEEKCEIIQGFKEEDFD